MRLSVSPATAAVLPAACRLLATPAPGPDRDLRALRYRDLLTSGELDPAGLLVARDPAGTVRGAILVQPLRGALGLAWPAQAEPDGDRAAVEDALTAAACGWLRSRGVKVCQSFAAEADRPGWASLTRHEFRLVTQVTHLRAEAACGLAPIADPLTFERVSSDNRDAFGAALLATYDSSLDCPEVAGDRTPVELLDGFRTPLTLRPEWWFLARHEGEPVGVVLFDAGTEPGVLELNYLGLVPTARGRGWGDALMRFVFRTAAEDRDTAVNLSVDVRNEPARRLYERHGFWEYDRRDVYLAAWPARDDKS